MGAKRNGGIWKRNREGHLTLVVDPPSEECAAPKHFTTVDSPHDLMNKTNAVLKNYYVLPCCLLLLNLVNSFVGYKAEMIDEPFLRTLLVIFLVLCGSSIMAFIVAPAIDRIVKFMQRGSRQGGGRTGEVLFLLILGAALFWCYYQLCNHGPAALLPVEWRNPK